MFEPYKNCISFLKNVYLYSHKNRSTCILQMRVNMKSLPICRYFRAMSKGETPPVTERLEMPVATQKTDSGLTPGLLRVLNKQVSFLSLEMLFI